MKPLFYVEYIVFFVKYDHYLHHEDRLVLRFIHEAKSKNALGYYVVSKIVFVSDLKGDYDKNNFLKTKEIQSLYFTPFQLGKPSDARAFAFVQLQG